MAETVSIVISVKENYSTVMSKLSAVSKTFAGELENIQKKLVLLNNTKTKIDIDASNVWRNLDKVKKASADAGEAISKASRKAEDAGENFDQMGSNLQIVEQAARDAEKEIQNLSDTMNRTENNSAPQKKTASAGAGKGGMLSALASSGLTEMLADGVMAMGTARIGSALTDQDANMITGTLGGALSGAAMGTAIAPGVGTLVGALIGGISGALTAAAQNFEEEDDYFKGIVNDTLDEYKEQIHTSLENGTKIAASREQSSVSFKTLLGGKQQADSFLAGMEDFAAKTPYTYDQLTAMSSALLKMGYSAEGVLPLLTDVGNAGAALGWGAQEQADIAGAMARLHMSDTASMEYLDPLRSQGVDVFSALRQNIQELRGKTDEEIRGHISNGELNGSVVFEAISRYLQSNHAGAMEELSGTYAGKAAALEEAEANRDAAMGKGYNEERKKGIDAQVAFLSDERVKNGYEAMGGYQAEIENKKEEIERESIQKVMELGAYKKAEADGDGRTITKLMGQAAAQAKAEWMKTDEFKNAADDDVYLLTEIRNTLVDSNWKAGFAVEQEKTKGQDAAYAAVYAENAAKQPGDTVEFEGVTLQKSWSAYEYQQGQYQLDIKEHGQEYADNVLDKYRKRDQMFMRSGMSETEALSPNGILSQVNTIAHAARVAVAAKELNIKMGEIKVKIEQDETFKQRLFTETINAISGALGIAFDTGA